MIEELLELRQALDDAGVQVAELHQLLEAGLGVIIELGLFDPWGQAKLATLFAGFPAFVVRVSCDLGTLEQRERARGDRHVGTARRQWEQLWVSRTP